MSDKIGYAIAFGMVGYLLAHVVVSLLIGKGLL